MSQLKQANLKKCYSFLKDFINDSGVEDNKKGFAVMALNQLRQITAGDGLNATTNSGPKCLTQPLGG